MLQEFSTNSGQHVTPGWSFHSWYHHCCLFHHADGIKNLW